MGFFVVFFADPVCRCISLVVEIAQFKNRPADLECARDVDPLHAWVGHLGLTPIFRVEVMPIQQLDDPTENLQHVAITTLLGSQR